MPPTKKLDPKNVGNPNWCPNTPGGTSTHCMHLVRRGRPMRRTTGSTLGHGRVRWLVMKCCWCDFRSREEEAVKHGPFGPPPHLK